MSLTRSRNIVYSPTVQFELSVAVSNIHFVSSAGYSDALKTVIHHLLITLKPHFNN